LDVLRQKFDSGLLGWGLNHQPELLFVKQLYGTARKNEVQVLQAYLTSNAGTGLNFRS